MIASESLLHIKNLQEIIEKTVRENEEEVF